MSIMRTKTHPSLKFTTAATLLTLGAIFSGCGKKSSAKKETSPPPQTSSVTTQQPNNAAIDPAGSSPSVTVTVIESKTPQPGIMEQAKGKLEQLGDAIEQKREAIQSTATQVAQSARQKIQQGLTSPSDNAERVIALGNQTLPATPPTKGARALAIGSYRKSSQNAYARHTPDLKGNPFYFVYDPRTGERLVDLSHLSDVPEGGIRLSRNHDRVIVQVAGIRPVREVYDVSSGKKIFEDFQHYDWSDEPQFDANGDWYFLRTGDSNLVMRSLTQASESATVAESEILAFAGQKSQPEIILLNQDGISLFNPKNQKTTTLERSQPPIKMESAWFFGNNEFAWRQNRNMLLPYKDTKISYWSSDDTFFTYSNQQRLLTGWDKQTGAQVFQETNIEDLKQDFMNPNLFIYKTENSQKVLDLNEANSEKSGDT